MKIRLLMIVPLLSAFTALPMAAHSAIVGNPGSISGESVIGGGDRAAAGESLYGIKFEGFTVDGDFFAKGGNESFAYNRGFGALDGANILVPDTVFHLLPESATMLLLASGLLCIAVWGRRRRRMRN
jgi:hypothetical protein